MGVTVESYVAMHWLLANAPITFQKYIGIHKHFILTSGHLSELLYFVLLQKYTQL